MGYLLFFLLIIGAGIVSAVIKNAAYKERREALDARLQNLPDFTPTQKVVGAGSKSAVAIDEQRKTIGLITENESGFLERVISYRDLISVELFEDGNTITKTSRSSQIGGAIVGGLLLGGLGALAGGLSGKKNATNTITRIDLRLILNDTATPLHDVVFLATECKKDGALYKLNMQQARHWHGVFEVLIKRAEAEQMHISAAPAPPLLKPQNSTADELAKLASLRDSGVLTSDEFQAQKRLLLGVPGGPASVPRLQAPEPSAGDSGSEPMDPDTLVRKAISASRSPTRRPDAIRALNYIIRKYPGSQSARLAQAHLVELG
jgi:hypothetical protein